MRLYRDLLRRWGSTLNLVSKADATEQGLQRHIEDSLAIVPHLASSTDSLIDLGSGQGFPAIPVSIATGIRCDLIEADRRKAAFLSTVLATLTLPGRVHCTRIEQTSLLPSSCVTARALATVGDLISMARPFLRPDGYCLFLKGPAAGEEVADAALASRFHAQITLVSTRSNLVKITDLR